ncbi:MAG: ectoine hydroxylase [Steroidobacteraceae bacterium]
MPSTAEAHRDDPYPTRHQGSMRVLDRQDPVVYGDNIASTALNENQIDAYRERGYLLLPRLLDRSEIEALIADSHRLRANIAVDDDSVITEPRSETVRSIFRLQARSRIFAALFRDERLLNVARYLLGGNVYIHQTRLNFKPGFVGKEFYWHSDFETWHAEDGMPRMRAVSVSINLTENTHLNGPLMLIPGSHRRYVSCAGVTPDNHFRESLRAQHYGVPDPATLELLVRDGGIDAAIAPAGSATFFDCNIMHGSNSNITPFARTNIFVVYNSVDNTMQEPYGAARPRPDFLAERSDTRPLTPTRGGIRGD